MSNKNKIRCAIYYCKFKALWEFHFIGHNSYMQDFIIYRCFKHENNINIDKKYILAKIKHPNKKTKN